VQFTDSSLRALLFGGKFYPEAETTVKFPARFFLLRDVNENSSTIFKSEAFHETLLITAPGDAGVALVPGAAAAGGTGHRENG
jgi:hypothetical protein